MKNKGITLVALVITIIILLILAGIAISQLTGSGLFENSKLAKEKYANAQEKEEITLGDYENKIIEEMSRETVISKEDIYSTDEKVAGKWLNGETLYRKVITGTINSSSTQTFTHNVSNIDVCFIEGAYLVNNGNYHSIDLDNHFVECYVSDTTISIEKTGAPAYQNCPVCFIIEYTKKANNS